MCRCQAKEATLVEELDAAKSQHSAAAVLMAALEKSLEAERHSVSELRSARESIDERIELLTAQNGLLSQEQASSAEQISKLCSLLKISDSDVPKERTNVNDASSIALALSISQVATLMEEAERATLQDLKSCQVCTLRRVPATPSTHPPNHPPNLPLRLCQLPDIRMLCTRKRRLIRSRIFH